MNESIYFHINNNCGCLIGKRKAKSRAKRFINNQGNAEHSQTWQLFGERQKNELSFHSEFLHKTKKKKATIIRIAKTAIV